MSSPTAVDGGETTVAGAYAADRASPLVSPSAPAPAQQAAFHDFGEAGKQAERRDIVDLDTVFVRFENGVRLTVKPTKFKPEQVSVRVAAPGGIRASVPGGPTWSLAALVDGAAAILDVRDDAVTVSGSGARDDLEAVLRTLAPPLVDPVWRQDALERARRAELARLEQGGRTVDGALALALPALLHGGDGRWTAPSRSAVAALTLGDARRDNQPLVSGGPLQVLIVGDVTIDKAIDAVANTFGALPARPAGPDGPSQNPAVTPVATSTSIDVGGAAQAGRVVAVWPAASGGEPRDAGVAAVLQQVLRTRIGDPEPSDRLAGLAVAPADWGRYIAVAATGAPERLASLAASQFAAAASLTAQGLGPGEVEAAKAELLRAEDAARHTNDHWLDLLAGAQDDARRLAAIRAESAAIARVTVADVRQAAGRYLRETAALRLAIRPGGS